MLDRILDQRLEHHARDDQVERGRIDMLVDLQLRAEADALDPKKKGTK